MKHWHPTLTSISCCLLCLFNPHLFSAALNSSYFQKPTLTCHAAVTLNLFLQPEKSSTYMSPLWPDTEMSSIQGIGITCGIFILEILRISIRIYLRKVSPTSYLYPNGFPSHTQTECNICVCNRKPLLSVYFMLDYKHFTDIINLHPY